MAERHQALWRPEAVKSVSLAMNEGEILFIIGPNGAGKTTVFKSDQRIPSSQ